MIGSLQCPYMHAGACWVLYVRARRVASRIGQAGAERKRIAMRVIGAGFGRTGTHSIKTALERLGLGPCHHMYEVRNNPATLGVWQEAAGGAAMDWAAAFRGYVSQVDWPGAAYWSEIAGAFPDAKVILSVRDPEEWYESIRQTILPSVRIGRQRTDDDFARDLAEMIHRTVDVGLFGGRLHERSHALKVFAEHIEAVRDTISRDRLLIFSVADGWKPLCDFLGKQMPDGPFPSTNSKEEFLRRKPEIAAAIRSYSGT